MQATISSLTASMHLPGRLTRCSWEQGWRSLLLREYAEPPVSGPFRTLPCGDHLIVLVLDGPCDIRGRYRGVWEEAHYGIGSMGTTRPGEEVIVDFRGEVPGRTLQLHLAEPMLRRTATELAGRSAHEMDLPHRLMFEDAFVRQAMWSLAAALEQGAPELYAQTCAQMLAVHLLVRYGGHASPPAGGREPGRLRRVDALMRANLGAPLTLEQLAAEAGVSCFHLIRLFKSAYGETPYRRLTRMRMEAAQARLRAGDESIMEIALSYGYGNPAHFAAAFRRIVGMAPSAYRMQRP